MKPKILIVDDHAANRETLSELLDEQDYDLEHAADGPTALQLAAKAPPDLILLDVMMPGMDGYEVCRRLRGDPHLAEVPVIIITALDDAASRLTGLEAGADDFVTKPFNRGELRARTRTITRLNRYRRLQETQAKLSESEMLFQKLAEHSEEVFWFMTLAPEAVSYISPAVEKIWGEPAGRFHSDPSLWTKGIHPDDQDRVRAAYEAVATGRQPRFAEEFRVVQPAGGVRWVLNSGTPISGEGEAIVSMAGVARDITERKMAEEQMLRAQRLESLGMLSAGIAHDFNNALAPIIMAGSILQAHVSDPNGLRLLATVEKSAQRGAALVRQLLTFAGGSSDKRENLQVRHLLKELGELAETTFPKSIQVRTQLADDLRSIRANPTQIHQVFLNLCVNARDAMPQGGQIAITAENRVIDVATAAAMPNARAGDFVMVEVRDTGTGISPDVLARIWEPFFTTKGPTKGTGLGLSTVRGIAQQHGGFVTVETRPGRGTAFTVYLPAVQHGEANHAGARIDLSSRGNNELILAVDDEEPVRRLLEQALVNHGYRVVTAGNGAEAIAEFASRAAEVRLLITDLQMPILSGPALATTLRRLNPHLPVIAMSGASSQAGSTYKAFTSAFLAKPFQVESLLSIVRQTLDSPMTEEPATAIPILPTGA